MFLLLFFFILILILFFVLDVLIFPLALGGCQLDLFFNDASLANGPEQFSIVVGDVSIASIDGSAHSWGDGVHDDFSERLTRGTYPAVDFLHLSEVCLYVVLVFQFSEAAPIPLAFHVVREPLSKPSFEVVPVVLSMFGLHGALPGLIPGKSVSLQ